MLAVALRDDLYRSSDVSGKRENVLPHLMFGQCIEHCIPSINYAENPARFDSPFLKRHPGALARYSVERVSAVFRSDGC